MECVHEITSIMSIVNILNTGNVLRLELYDQNKRTMQFHTAVGHRVDICIVFGIYIVQLFILQYVVLVRSLEIRYFHDFIVAPYSLDLVLSSR